MYYECTIEGFGIIIQQKIANNNFTMQQIDPKAPLQQILQYPKLTPQMLFKVPDILQRIKSDMQKFLQFCIQNTQFFNKMLALSIKTPPAQNETQQSKKIVHVATQLLNCDHDCIGDLFIIDKNKQRMRLYSDESCQEIITSEQTGQLVLADKQEISYKNEFEYKYKNFTQLFSYLQDPKIDENSMNYLCKIFNTIIRAKSDEVYQFFMNKPQVMQNFIKFTHYPGVSYTIVKLLNQTEQQKHRNQKKAIVSKFIEHIVNQIQDQNFYVYMEFVEELNSKNRFRGQEIDQIKIISEELVEQKIVSYMIKNILKACQENSQNTQNGNPKHKNYTLINSLIYLHKIAERMNIDEEKDPYSYEQQKILEPTLPFHSSPLYQNLPKMLINLPGVLVRHNNYNTQEIFILYNLFEQLMKNSRFEKYCTEKINGQAKKQFYETVQKSVYSLLKEYNAQKKNKKNGLIMSTISRIIQKLENILHYSQVQIQKNKIKKKQQQNFNEKFIDTQKEQHKQNSNDQIQNQQYAQIKPTLQQISNYISKSIQQQSSSLKQKEHLCFDQKHKILFDNKSDEDLNKKYTNSLYGNNYTSNRQYKVEQFSFVGRKADQLKELESASKSINEFCPYYDKNHKQSFVFVDQGKKENQDTKQVCKVQVESPVVNLTDQIPNSFENGTKNSIGGFKLDILNERINALKAKKQKKNSQQDPKQGEEIVKQNTQLIKDDQQQNNSGKANISEKKVNEEKTMVKKDNYVKEAYEIIGKFLAQNYYTRHLILY